MKYLPLILVPLMTVHANSFVGMWIGKDKPMAIEFKANQEVYFGEMKVSTYTIDENNQLVFELSNQECFAEVKGEEELRLHSFGRAPDALIRAKNREVFLEAFEALRWDSKQKTIANNLRQILLTGQRYLKESGLAQITFEELIELQLIDKRVAPQDGESYSGIIITQETDSLTVLTESGKAVSYPFQPSQK